VQSGQKNGPCLSTAQVLGGNAHKGDAATERQGRYPVAALQNMILRVREVKLDRAVRMKRFYLFKSVS
jgi:hypothetical protein